MADRLAVPPSLLISGLLCRCPNCGRGRLFSGYLEVNEHCLSCGETLAAHEQGDGPAVFVILILGFMMVGFALFVEARFTPPMWVHAVIWPPLIVGSALGMLRPLKAIMVGVHFRHCKGEIERG